MSPHDAINDANAALRALGFTPDEARVEPFDGVALLRGDLIRQHVEPPGNLARIIAALPTRDTLLELKRQAADQ